MSGPACLGKGREVAGVEQLKGARIRSVQVSEGRLGLSSQGLAASVA